MAGGQASDVLQLLRGMVDGAKDAGISITYEQVLAKWSGTTKYPLPAGSENEKLPPEVFDY